MKKIMTAIVLMLLVLLPIKVLAIQKPALSSLEIQTGAEPNSFDLSTGKTTFTYNLTGNYEKINVVATPVNESYTISGDGEIEVNEGQNVIAITVTDPSDNSSLTYRIGLKLTKTDEAAVIDEDTSKDAVDPVTTTGEDAKTAEETSEKNPKTGSFVSYIILSLIVLIPIIILISRKRIYKL